MKNEQKKDMSRIHERGQSTENDLNYRINLEDYFENDGGTNVEKLENFPKYVPRQVLSRFVSKYEIFKKILRVQGSIIECGVYLGGGLMTFAQLSAILEPVNHQRKIIGFDTFTGFANLSKEDRKGNSIHLRKGGLAVDSYDGLKKSIEIYDSNRYLGHVPKVFLVKGDISSTLPRYLKNNPHTVVSLLYLDADVFKPTKVALEHLVHRMPKGAIIAFDELNADNWPGETLAVLRTIGIKNLRIRRFTFDTLISFAVIE